MDPRTLGRHERIAISLAIQDIEAALVKRWAKWGEQVGTLYWVEDLIPSGWERRADHAEAELLHAHRLEVEQLRRDIGYRGGRNV